MVASLNTLGLDFITFDNHEFDLNENELIERMNESIFTWISSNRPLVVGPAAAATAPPLPPSYVSPEVEAAQLVDDLEALSRAVPGVISAALAARLRQLAGPATGGGQQQPPPQQPPPPPQQQQQQQ